MTIIVNRDRYEVINDLTQALLDKWNGQELFSHGGVISRRSGDSMSPVDRGSFNDLIQATARTMNENEGVNGATQTFAWPDGQTMMAVMSRADRFAHLDRLAHAPFVRPDGTIVTEPGYDEATRTILMPDEAFSGLQVPENPTADEVRKARDLILTEWLGDFPLDDEPDRANLLALVVTPAIRGMVPRAPMAVIDGLQMGVGKNLLADSLLTVYTGHAAQPMNWVEEADELRKQITSAFRTGAEFFVFDEAHTLEGAALAQALTAETWQDRILGVSTMANFPNRVTWMSLGNNVQVKGDITRRVYRIALRPRYANPQDRQANTFRHPGQSGLDLLSWTRKHRRELMTAILTVVRAWFAAGQPLPKRGVSFGSFENWERITGGIVQTAGLDGFLDNLKVWRSESDFDSQYWTGHLNWLYDQFGDQKFRTSDVKTKALTLGTEHYPAPPKLDDPTEKTYGKALGEAYGRIRDRRYGTFWLERAGFAHGHVTVYRVHNDADLPPAPELPPWDPAPEPGPTLSGCGCSRVMRVYCHAENCQGGADLTEVDTQPSTPDSQVADSDLDVWDPFGDDVPEPGPAPYNEHGEARGADESDLTGGLDEVRPPAPAVRDEKPASVLTFDLETGDATELYKRGQDYVRIGAVALDDRPVRAYDDATAWNVTADLLRHRDTAVITGHNIMAFDLPALVRSGQLTMSDVHEWAEGGHLFDALLAARYLDPPMARDKGVDAERKYDLGALGERFGLGEKLTDVSHSLAKRYGGWDGIPIDNSADGLAFKDYMIQDVELSRRLHARLMEELGGTVPEYLVREHRVAALATQISVNGFKVDQELLGQRVAEVQDRKAKALKYLEVAHDLKLTNDKGEPYRSPLATKAGKEAIGAALVRLGVPERSLWRTEKSKDLQLNADAMLHYGREYGQRSPELGKLVTAVYRIVSARSVYETLRNHTCPDGRVHPRVSFRQATGRWSLTEPGLTVLGKRGGRHVERAVLIPDEGEVLIAVDLSQVDMRAVAGLSQDEAYIEMLKMDDPHTELAVMLFGDASFREKAKAIGHGWNYGESLRRISQENNIDPAIVNKFDTSMRERFPRLLMWREEVRALAESGALLDNGWGRLMRPDPQRAHTQGPALMGQGAARDIMMNGLLRLDARIRPMLRAQVHDEVVLSVPSDMSEEIGREVVEALSFEWNGVPITADVSRPGTDWSVCYSKS